MPTKIVAAVLGVLCGFTLTRVILMIATQPHGVILYAASTTWQGAVAVGMGILAGSYLFARPTRWTMSATAILLVASCAILALLLNVSIANKIIPGFWVK